MTPNLYDTLLSRFARPMTDQAEPPPPPDATEDYDARAARFDAARDATIQSFRNRLGRDPSEIELRDAMPIYMTDEDRKAYMQLQAARWPYLARGLPVPPRFVARPSTRIAPPPPSPLSDDLPESANRNDEPGRLGLIADALWKTIRAGVLARNLPADIVSEVVERGLPEARLRDLKVLRTAQQSVEDALRSHVRFYDDIKSDTDRSYQTYTKERINLGPCRVGEKPDPRYPCYYAGWTGNEFDPWHNVWLRDQAQYPTPSYKDAQLDCSTRSWVAGRAREQQLIEHFRSHGLSDNAINSIADHAWRPYMMELAARDCGDRPLPPPIPR